MGRYPTSAWVPSTVRSARQNDLGRVRYMTGDLPGAEDAHARALEIYRRIGNRIDEPLALNHYAAIIAATGERPRALALYQQALTMSRELNCPANEAVSLEGLAEHHLATGNPTQGIEYLRQALHIYQHLGMRADIERVTTGLAGLAPQ
jgi:tetratricopeptide (TPR) repeat protein